MKKIIEVAEFMWYFILSRIVRFFMTILDKRGPLDVAMISNYRDKVDVRKFGFWDISKTPNVLSWTRYVWEGKKGRLFMIGALTEQIVGENATLETISRASRQFKEAVKKATSLGAKVILFAAANKRLPIWGELKKEFPGVIFTLGDNFTALLIEKRIAEAFEKSRLNPKSSRVLVIAPYGFLGTRVLSYVLSLSAEVVGLGNPNREKLLIGTERRYGIKMFTSFEEIGKVDLVIACNSSSRSQLTPQRVNFLRKDGRRLIVIDFTEPQNMTPENYKAVANEVIRLDAGNGYSTRLTYVLEPLAYKLLRLSRGETWGCFAEAFLIEAHSELRMVNWREISPANMDVLRKFIGPGIGQFDLPYPTCFNEPVNCFNIED